MKRTALFLLGIGALVALAFGVPALAQGTSANCSSAYAPCMLAAPPLSNVPTQTTGATALYVDSTGNDANACTSSGTGACLTLQAAVNKIPSRVAHPVTVTVGAGNFTGAILPCLTFDTSANTSGASLVVQGTLAAATLTSADGGTGVATGTATSGTAGSLTSATTFGTITDTGQSWATNNLRGKLIVTTGGTGSGQTKAIASNTATAITIAGTWTAPANGTTYIIEDPSSVINATKATPATGVTASNTFAASGLTMACNTGSWNAGIVGVQWLKFAIASGNAISMRGPGATYVIRQNEFVPPSGTTAQITIQNADAQILNNGAVLNVNTFISSGATGVTAGPANAVTIDGNVIYNASFGVTGTGGFAFQNNYGLTVSTAFFNSSGGGLSSFAGNLLDCSSGGSSKGISVTGTGTTLAANTVIDAAGGNWSSISNCAKAVDLAGPSFVNIVKMEGTGNTVGLSAYRGAAIQVDAASTITGSNEVDIDGTTSTLATMRGNTPKVSKSSDYFTKVFQ